MTGMIDIGDAVAPVSRTHSAPPAAESMVFVVDEDSDALDFVSDLLHTAGHCVEAFRNCQDFLCHLRPDRDTCVLVDAGPQGRHGLEVLHQLACTQMRPEVVVMTNHGNDIAMAVSAMRAGAVDVLAKPMARDDVLEAIDKALATHRLRRESRIGALHTLDRAATLTPRERQVMALVTAGLMNKQVADELNLSEISIKIHRGNLMKKMGVRSLPDLVRAADLIQRFA